MLCVWEQVESHEQRDYLDNLWSQLKKLQENEWKEDHISRYYNKFDSIFAETISHNLPRYVSSLQKSLHQINFCVFSILLPVFDVENVKYPMPRVVFRLFANSDCPKDVSLRDISKLDLVGI